VRILLRVSTFLSEQMCACVVGLHKSVARQINIKHVPTVRLDYKQFSVEGHLLIYKKAYKSGHREHHTKHTTNASEQDEIISNADN
jgi:hypothetical protein